MKTTKEILEIVERNILSYAADIENMKSDMQEIKENMIRVQGKREAMQHMEKILTKPEKGSEQ